MTVAPLKIRVVLCGLALCCLLIVAAYLALLQGADNTASASIPTGIVAGGGTATPTPTCGPVWEMVQSSNTGNESNTLTGMDEVGNGKVWAVGWGEDEDSVTLPVAQLWDGSQWVVAATPPMTESGYLNAVDALDEDDVWAVGYKFSSQGAQTLVMHWDGAQWATFPSPNRSNYQFHDYLTGVTMVAPDDVWAVGYYKQRQANFYWNTLVLHWDGVSWEVVESPNVIDSTNNVLTSVSAVAENDIWAVGYEQEPGEIETLTMHWDGTDWTIVEANVSSGDFYYLYGVSAYSSNEVWAAGYYEESSGTKMFTLKWNGTTWQRSNPLNPSQYANELYGIKVRGPGDVWVVGMYGTGSFGMDEKALSMRLIGGSWHFVPAPSPSVNDNRLNAVTMGSTGEMWAGGNYRTDNRYSLTLRYPTDGCVTPGITITPTPIILPSRTATSTYTPSCGLAWREVASEDPHSFINNLTKIEIISENDIYAAGTDVQHWDGTEWSTLTDPEGKAVAGTAPDDVWVVGTFTGGSNEIDAPTGESGVQVPRPVATTPPGYYTRTYHWDGVTWTHIPSPSPSFYSFLRDVDAIEYDDVWAIGGYGSSERSLALHWDGLKWTQIDAPSANKGDDTTLLQAVHVNAANDVWAAGYYVEDSIRSQYFVIHWDGSTWSISLMSTGFQNEQKELYDISGTGPNDMWGVGTNIVHWDGTTWTETSNPVPGSELSGVVATAPNDVWVVGATNNDVSTLRETVVLHWDGNSWTRIPSPNPDPYSSALQGVTARGPYNVWAVGFKGRTLSGSTTRTLIERYWDPCAPPTATPTPNLSATSTRTRIPSRTPTQTNTPTPTMTFTLTPTKTHTPTITRTPTVTPTWTNTGTPTNTATKTNTATGTSTVAVSSTPAVTDTTVALTSTPVQASPTLMITPTVCVIQFADVQEGSTFYEFVRCLACRGIINGYACGGAGEPCNGGNEPYFRPNNNVTRGQIAKIVANAAGFADPATIQTFEDVPLGSTFYEFVERLAARSVIGGYACGGAGEPCGPENRPYFRPNGNTTRGQLAKIVCRAFGCTGSASGQTFEDVTSQNTFYVDIEQLYSLGSINGYACGGVGEPCVGPGNRPYFRPANSVTRGQTSKIVSSTFFPGCEVGGR